MYDTILLELEPAFGYYTRADMEQVLAGLTKGSLKESNYSSAGYVSGYLRNLRVYMNDTKLKIEGSISEFIKGNQFAAISLPEIQEAVEQITGRLKMPMQQAKVKRLDFALNIITDFKPAAYFPFFGLTQGYRRQELDNGFYYKHTNRMFAFYDKTTQMKRTHQAIPAAFQDKYLLRMEFRLTGHVSRQLNREQVTAALLYDPAFYQQVQALFFQEYNGLYKHYEFAAGTVNIRCTADVISFIVMLGVQKLGGMRWVFQLIEHLKQIKQLSSGAAFQARQQLKKA